MAPFPPSTQPQVRPDGISRARVATRDYVSSPVPHPVSAAQYPTPSATTSARFRQVRQHDRHGDKCETCYLSQGGDLVEHDSPDDE